MKIFPSEIQALTKNDQKMVRSLFGALETLEVLYRRQKKTLYPKNITKEEILKSSKNSQLLSPYSKIVQRGKTLASLPYREAYSVFLQNIAHQLQKSSQIGNNRIFQKLLGNISKALLSDDYESLEKKWLRIHPRHLSIDVTFGPYESGNDTILGKKKFYTGILMRVLGDETNELQKLYNVILENNTDQFLPQICSAKPKRVSLEISNILAWSGQFTEMEFAGWSRPAEQKMYEQFGSKKLIFLNILKKRVEKKMLPLFKKYFDKELVKKYSPLLSQYAHYYVALHELSHTIGKYPEMAQNLGEYYSSIEEARAETLSQKIASRMVKTGHMNSETRKIILLFSLISIFFFYKDSQKNHGRGFYLLFATYVFHKLKKEKALRIKNHRIFINFQKTEIVYHQVSDEMNGIACKGDKARAVKMVRNIQKLSKNLSTLL